MLSKQDLSGEGREDAPFGEGHSVAARAGDAVTMSSAGVDWEECARPSPRGYFTISHVEVIIPL